MTTRLEYHIPVRHPASVALFALFLLPAVVVSNSHAQTHGAPSSVTSPGFGGHAVNGTPASVTSLGPHGYAPSQHVTFSTAVPSVRDDGHHHHHHFVNYAPSIVYAPPVPYAVDISATDDRTETSPDDSEADEQGGPTIFDRRGSGRDSYVPPVRDVPHSTQRADVGPPAPEPPPEPTLLVFKDGHKLEVWNYAIVGATLFDLTPGHARRVALADLDLEATQRQNDDRGVSFQLPPTPQAN